ncbi:MAG: MBL fold metallo-hydrolase [Methanobacterium sp.]|nr:MBL fold metallo-hydrolase [Methanobacterium sp.]
MRNKVIHIDPGYIGYFENQGIPKNELKKNADLIMVTHFHKDHLQPEALAKIRGQKTIVLAPKNAPRELKVILK